MSLPQGFKITGIKSGLSKKDKKDMGLIFSEFPCLASAVFTTNRIQAAPIILSKTNIKNKFIQAVIVNSGQANACTGKRGLKDAFQMASLVAQGLGIKKETVLVASTGVIGDFLPMKKIRRGIKKIIQEIKNQNSLLNFAQAIMTTDTFPKIKKINFTLGNKKVTLLGIAKGSGMVNPDLATMLCFILTDLAMGRNLLNRALKKAIQESFQRITVDGETSTNDCVFLLANGRAKNNFIRKPGTSFKIFQTYLNQLVLNLAKLIVKDGEGATKFIEIRVEKAKSFGEAKKAAQAVATSPLVKTAIFGQNLNWGRILAAIGYSGAKVEPDKIEIFLNSQRIVKNGEKEKFSEKKVKQLIKKKQIKLTINLNQGNFSWSVYTCDFSYDYIKINASYLS